MLRITSEAHIPADLLVAKVREVKGHVKGGGVSLRAGLLMPRVLGNLVK